MFSDAIPCEYVFLAESNRACLKVGVSNSLDVSNRMGLHGRIGVPSI